MVQQFTEQQTPSIRIYNEETGESESIYYIDIQEISPDTTVRLSKHVGESGKVYVNTRTIQPARFRARIIIPDIANSELDALGDDSRDAIYNILDASYKTPVKFTVTSFYLRCYNAMITSSRRRDTNDMIGVCVQDVVFEECISYSDNATEVEDFEDSGFTTASPSFIKPKS